MSSGDRPAAADADRDASEQWVDDGGGDPLSRSRSENPPATPGRHLRPSEATPDVQEPDAGEIRARSLKPKHIARRSPDERG